jgi:hypothetical protein
LSRIILIISMIPISWLGMMAVHETGHVLAALLTGGEVQRVILHPLVFSRTDVQPNPSPLFVVWAGPIVGVLLPAALAGVMAWARIRVAYIFTFFAGFCLLANGAYIGVGAFEGVGDAGDMLRLGSPRWLLVAFGGVCAGAGFYLWHLVSPHFGFGRSPRPVSARDALGAVSVAMSVLAVGLIFGNRGG